MVYGSYHSSQFMMELNRDIIPPGDFHRYIFIGNARENIRNPKGTKGDPANDFAGENPLDEAPDDSESVMISMYTIFHEATHILQDYSLGSEILRDVLTDMINYEIQELMRECQKRGEIIRFPLMAWMEENKLCHTHLGNLLERYEEIYMFGSSVKIIEGDDAHFIGITTEDLLEAYAAARSYNYMTQIEPPEYQENYLNRAFFNKNMDEEYEKAWTLYKTFVSFEDRNYAGDKITDSLKLDLTGFLLVCDISLHIPPFLFYNEKMETQKVPEYGLPHVRFIRALQTLNKNGGFPDAIEGENFYVTLYDFIAKDHGWPAFARVTKQWNQFFVSRLKSGVMVSDVYRSVVADFKGKKGSAIIFNPPVQLFSELGIPVLVRYFSEKESFFEYTHIIGKCYFAVMDNSFISPTRNPRTVMEQYYNVWTWDRLIDAAQKEGMKCIWDMSTIFLREIYCRIISKNFYRSAVQESCFSCPVIDLNCREQLQSCHSIKSFRELPENCCLKIWFRDAGLEAVFEFGG